MKADIKKKQKTINNFLGREIKKKKKDSHMRKDILQPIIMKKIYKDIKGSPFLFFTWYSLTLFVILPCYPGNYCAHGICVSVRLGRWNTLSQAEGPLLIYYQERQEGKHGGFFALFFYIYISDNSLLRFGDRDGKENDPFPRPLSWYHLPSLGCVNYAEKEEEKKGGINAEHVI